MTGKLGLKCRLLDEQINDRLSHSPDIFEIQLTDEDITNPAKTADTIRNALTIFGGNLYLHAPMRVGDMYVTGLCPRGDASLGYRALFFDVFERSYRIASILGSKLVYHLSYTQSPFASVVNPDTKQAMWDTLGQIHSGAYPLALLENSAASGYGDFTNFDVQRAIHSLNIPLCFDVSHVFIARNGDNIALVNTISALAGKIRYVHLADSMGLVHDGLPLGDGLISWASVKKCLKDLPHHPDYIFEVDLKDYNNCDEMLASRRFYDAI